jgi:hypothetical protein
MRTTPSDIPFIVEQISKCVRLAGQCADPEISYHLIKLARRFETRAVELSADTNLIPEISELADSAESR